MLQLAGAASLGSQDGRLLHAGFGLISSKTIRADLDHERARKRDARGRGLLAGLLALLLALGLVSLWVWRLAFADLPAMPDRSALWSLNRPPGVTFLDRTGAVIAVRGPREGQMLKLGDLPPYVPRAFLAAEDRRFYSHHGVDWLGVARAARADFGARRVVQGGSTITQQVARNIFLTPEQTLRRKLQEAALAWRIEGVMGKDEILELYLNRIYFGEGAYGIEAAAQTYFGKSARRLSLHEAALLAALPKAPTRLDPTNDLDSALSRAHLALGRMQRAGWITQGQERAALASPLALQPEKPGEGDFGYVLDLAAARARLLAGDKAPDLIVRLTVDSRLQAAAADTVRQGVAEGRRLGANQAALVALSPDGAIRALVGGVDYRQSPYDRATQAMRQPGSAFKPFVYAAALEAGVRPQDVRTDSPVHYAGWSPENYGGGYSGAVTVADALARSINTVAVRLGHEVGPARIAELAHRFGLSMIPPHPALPIALGAYEVDLLDLVSGYQVFQNDGRRLDPFLIEAIANAHGDVLYRHAEGAASQVYDAGRSREMVQMMQGVVARGTGKRAALDRPAAGKTGTSQDWRDAWFVGFTPDWIAGVWVGNDRAEPMAKVAGGDLPSEMWRRFMIVAHQGLPSRDFAASQPGEDAPPPSTSMAAEQRTGPEIPAADAETRDEAQPPPDEAPQARRDERSDEAAPDNQRRTGFYSGLADDFGHAAQGEDPQ